MMEEHLKYPFIEGNKDLPKDKEEDIRELNKWLQTQPHLPKISAEYLHLFLHSNYYNIEETKSTIEQFYMQRAASPELFSNRTSKNPIVRDQLEIAQFGILPHKTPEGYQVVVIGFRNRNASKFSYTDYNKATFAFFDVAISETGLCPGNIAVIDTKDFTFYHFLRISISAARKSMSYIQEGLPVRVKQVIVINAAPLIDTVFAFFKPFMKQSLIDLVQIHGTDLTEFYKIVPREILYKDFGGPLGTLSEAHENYLQLLETKYLKWLEDESVFEVDMAKHPKSQRKSFFSFW